MSILDVADSIHKTKNPSSFQLNQQKEKSQSPFSLKLHPRGSVRGVEYSDYSNEGLFVGAAGLLGLGGGLLALPSQLNTTSFSYCLVDRDSDSASTVEFETSLPPDAVVAPLLRNPFNKA